MSLQIQNLSDPWRMKIEEDVIYELSHLPKTFSELYSIAFDQLTSIGHSSVRVAISALQLLTIALAPIGWPEILFILSAPGSGLGRSISKRELLDMTLNFLEDDKAENRPRFVHPSAREYLESRTEFRPDAANMKAALLTLDCIKHYDPKRFTVFNAGYYVSYLGTHLASTTNLARLPIRKCLDEFLIHPGASSVQDPVPRLFQAWRRLLYEWELSTRLVVYQTTDLSRVGLHPIVAVFGWGLEEYLDGQWPIVTETSLRHQWAFADDWRLAATWKKPWSEHMSSVARTPTAPEVAVFFNQHQLIRRLCSLEEARHCLHDFGSAGNTLVHWAAKLGHTETLAVLLEAGLNPNVLNIASRDPETTHNAGLNLRLGTSLGFRTSDGIYSPFAILKTGLAPLHLIPDCANGLACLRTLLQHGADPNLRAANGATPLQFVLEPGKHILELVQALLDAGADANACIDLGRSSILHMAASLGVEDVVLALLASGADRTTRDFFDRTPYDLAMRFKHSSLAKHLMYGTPEQMRPTAQDEKGKDVEENFGDQELPQEEIEVVIEMCAPGEAVPWESKVSVGVKPGRRRRRSFIKRLFK